MSLEELHRRGFAILALGKGGSTLTKETVGVLKRRARYARPIFNYDRGRDRKDDGRRRQALVRRGSCRQLTAALVDQMHDVFPRLQLRELRVLHSKAGCQRQNAHCDYEHPEKFAGLADEDVPLFGVVAIMDGTRLDIWPRVTTRKRGMCTTVSLDMGDVLLVRGDIVHAGSAYARDNYRLHFYLDSPAVKRRWNRTWLVNDV